MPGITPKGLPYPLPTEPVAEGAQRIRELAEAIATVEPWHVIGAAGEPGFQNSWVNYGAPFSTAAFYRDGAGRVWLKGTLKNGLGSEYCFGLPAGWRPAEQVSFKIYSQGDTAALCSIQTSGVVYLFTTANAQVILDGISFRQGG